MNAARTQSSTDGPFPDLPWESWQPTLATLHRFEQVVGKIRLAASPRRNHWWNVPFHLTGRGITTRPMGRDPIFAIDFDFLDHRLDITTTTGPRYSFPLVGNSVAAFTTELLHGLQVVGVHADAAVLRPFGLPDSSRSFLEDREHATYEPAAVTRYWRVLSEVNLVLEEFASTWSGKTSPVHHFWHTFDIALTRFGDRRIEHAVTVDAVTREAYSQEVISSGFWFGDETFPAAAFYSYTSPEPTGLPEEPLRPSGATWAERGSSHLAVLPYSIARASPDPRAAALAFYESAFVAGATRAGWDLERHRCPGGATDPYAHRGPDASSRPPRPKTEMT